jgi:hypothetical protein
MNDLLICQTTNAMTMNVLQDDLQLAEVDAAKEHPDRRHDDVIDERVDDGAERAADDHPDREGEGVRFDRKPRNSDSTGNPLAAPRATAPMIRFGFATYAALRWSDPWTRPSATR